MFAWYLYLYLYLYLYFFITFTFQLNSWKVLPSAILWASRGHRCRSFSPPVRAFNFYRAKGSAFPLLVDLHRMLLTHALALSGNHFLCKKKSLRVCALGEHWTREIDFGIYEKKKLRKRLSFIYLSYQKRYIKTLLSPTIGQGVSKAGVPRHMIALPTYYSTATWFGF